MKNLVPKIQKLEIKNHSNHPSNIRQSINPINESPNSFSSKINYKVFADNSRKNIKLANALENMKISLRSESASS